MASTKLGGRWATALLAWLGLSLSATGQSGPFPPPSASLLGSVDSGDDQQPDKGAGPASALIGPAPILSLTPSPSPTAAQPATISPAENPPERWPYMRFVQGTWLGVALEDERTQVYGWAQGNFTASSDRSTNLPYGWNYKANQFLLEQNWLRIDRAVVTSKTDEPTFGFRSDWMLPGSDYFFTLPRGIFNGQLTADNGRPNLYGIDPVQFYVEAYFPTIGRGLDVKFGRFFSQFGVEQIAAPDTVLISRSYTFIYTPFTQTGILTTTKLTESVTVQAGLVLGSDDFIDPVDNATFIGSLKWVNPDQRNSLLVNMIAGEGRFNQRRNFHNPEIFDVIATHKISANASYTFEALYGFTTNVPDIGTANWLGIVQYLTCNLTTRISAAARLEVFDDFQGQRTGFKGAYAAPAGVIAFRPVKWLQLRQELRYDYNTQSAPFEGKHSLFTATSDFLVRW
jgi:hypothetical protein